MTLANKRISRQSTIMKFLRNIRRIACRATLATVLTGHGVAGAAEVLTEFRPSSLPNASGSVSLAGFNSEMIELESGVLGHHAEGTMKQFRFSEPVWVVGYKTEILDSVGKAPRENYLCHTFFGDGRMGQEQSRAMRVMYSDSFTREVWFPDGFGVYLTPDDDLHWMPMFNNREDRPVRVSMKVELALIRQKDLQKPLRRLYSVLQSIQVPHLYFVSPGHHQKTISFKLPFEGRIHYVGAHIHPYAESVELHNDSRQENVWKGVRGASAGGELAGLGVYSNAEGYAVRNGETYTLTAAYNNTTNHLIDAMAGVFIFYSESIQRK